MLRYTHDDHEFMRVLRVRANQAIPTRLAHHATWRKAIVLGCVLVLSYVPVVADWAPVLHVPLLILFHTTAFLFVLAVAHDASHGAWSRTRRGNALVAMTFDVIGIESTRWISTHLRNHHAGPNVAGNDGALNTHGVLRLHPEQPRYWFHRAQHLYFPLVYGITTMLQCYVLNFGLPPKHGRAQWCRQFVGRCLFFSYTIVLPAWCSSLSVGWIVAASVMGHVICGLMIGLFFQTTHLTHSTSFPEAVDAQLEHGFATHCLSTTVDVAPSVWWVTWLSSGLNIHVTHHLLPDIAHEHLPVLAPIVAETAREFGLPYRRMSLAEAGRSHVRLLRRLGRKEPNGVPSGTSLVTRGG